MRRYLRVAVIEVSEESLRLLAPAELRAELESALDAHEGEAAGEAEDDYGEWSRTRPR